VTTGGDDDVCGALVGAATVVDVVEAVDEVEVVGEVEVAEVVGEVDETLDEVP
jgi:hypothetical protein